MALASISPPDRRADDSEDISTAPPQCPRGNSGLVREPTAREMRLQATAIPFVACKNTCWLLGKRRLELLFLLVRQVAGNDLKLRRRFEGLDDPVGRHLPDEQEQRRGPFLHLAPYLLEEVLADAVVGEVPTER